MRQNTALALVLFNLLLVGCCSKLELEKHVSIDAAFQSIVDDFVQESRAQGRPVVIDNLSIHFTNKFQPEILGECSDYDRGTFGTPTIKINSQDWPWESATQQKIILYHEMGHCVLWRGHNDKYLPSGYVVSIMNPYTQIDVVYLNNWQYYMWELFNGN